MLERDIVYRAVKSAGKRAEVPWIGLHTLRHTAGTLAFRTGWNAVQVQKLLGHHSPAFTLATYVHLLPDDLPEPTFWDELLEPPVEQQDGVRPVDEEGARRLQAEVG
jgi:integrase